MERARAWGRGLPGLWGLPLPGLYLLLALADVALRRSPLQGGARPCPPALAVAVDRLGRALSGCAALAFLGFVWRERFGLLHCAHLWLRLGVFAARAAAFLLGCALSLRAGGADRRALASAVGLFAFDALNLLWTRELLGGLAPALGARVVVEEKADGPNRRG